MITGRQVAAARELLNITQAELASWAKVGESTIYRFEQGHAARNATIQVIQTALEQRGIEFSNGNSPGVKLRPDKAVLPLH